MTKEHLALYLSKYFILFFIWRTRSKIRYKNVSLFYFKQKRQESLLALFPIFGGLLDLSMNNTVGSE